MNKTKFTVGAMLIAASMMTGVVAQAAESIQYFGIVSKQTPHLKLTEAWVSEMKKTTKVEWYPGQTCAGAPAANKFTGPKIIEFGNGPTWQGMQDGNNLCNISLDNNTRVISTVSAYYEICSKGNSDIKSVADIIAKKNLKIGHSARSALEFWATDFNKQYNVTVKPIIYSTSGAALTALLAGDVDLAFPSTLATASMKESKQILCFATTQPGMPESLTTLAPKVNPILNTLPVVFPVISQNVPAETVTKLQQAVAKTIKEIPPIPFVTIVVPANAAEEQKAKAYVNQIINDLYRLTSTMTVTK